MTLTLLSGCIDSENKENEILVFASASLRNVIQEIANNYKNKTGVSVVINFAGSNVLAKQIEAAGQADIYLSANVHWVNYLLDRGLIYDTTKRIFLSNSLVVIAPKQSSWVLETPSQLNSLPFKFLSLANPDAVPAGRYAKQYLKSLMSTSSTTQETVWDSVKDKILPAPDVRAAASMVEGMENIIGIVYKTDAEASDKLRILYEIEHKSDSGLERVKYVATGVKKKSDNKDDFLNASALDFLDYLMQQEAQIVFQHHGFDAIIETSTVTN